METGTVVRLTKDWTVTIGEAFEVELHPSGRQFDGPAKIVACYTNAQGFVVAKVVSDSDPTERRVTEILGRIKDGKVERGPQVVRSISGTRRTA